MSDVNATQLWVNPVVIRLVGADGVAQVIDKPMVAGRGPDVEFIIKDEFASRRHAKLVPGPDFLQVEDLGSVNGTFHNGEKKAQFTARNGDTITFNIARYTLEIGAQGASKPEPTPDFEATRLHVPKDPAPVTVPVATPAPEPKKAEPRPVEPRPEEAPAAKAPLAAKAEKAWWETSDEGPSKTMLIQPGQSGSAAELTQLLNLGAAEYPRLVIKSGPRTGQCFELKEGKTSIGRDAQCDIVLEDNGVSSKHAQLIHEGGTWKLINLLSSNGTFVNGERIQTAYLNPGDELRFGPTALLFQLPGAPSARAAVSQGSAVAAASAKKPNVAGIVAAALGFVVVLAAAGWLLL